MDKKILGVLGGMGPAASARFYSLLTEFTFAKSDREHIRAFIRSFPDIPDRTDFITGKCAQSPLDEMARGALELSSLGAQLIAIPCNTAEYFINELALRCPCPVITPVGACAELAFESGAKRIGIMATEGTAKARIYQAALSAYGIQCALPDAAEQEAITKIIYSRLKRNLAANPRDFLYVAHKLSERGCDAIVLGCTELSLIPMDERFQNFRFIDSLCALSLKCVRLCGYSLSEKGSTVHKQMRGVL